MNYSNNKFRKLLKYSYSHSSFYREYYSSYGISEKDLDEIPVEKLPLIDKKIVRENFYNIATETLDATEIQKSIESSELLAKAGKNFVVHTSGSTGIPCNFIYDKHAIDVIEANFIRLSIGGENGIGIGDFPIRSVYIAPVGNGYACTALAMNGIKAYHVKGIILDAGMPLKSWKNTIKKYSPNYLSGYPTCINLAAKLQEKNEIKFKPKKIITGGEPLNHENAIYYHKIFGADVIDYYGCTESILIGAGTSWYDGIYLFDDMNYTEVDKYNKLIITPLYNKVFPLIRYKLNDMVEGYTKKEYGMLPYTHINRVMGRNEELMWFTNENGERDFLHPLFIDDLNVKGINKYQFEQIDNKSFMLRCMKMPYASKNIEDEIRKQVDGFLRKKALSNINYKVIFVDKIDANPQTGKIKLVVRKENDYGEG